MALTQEQLDLLTEMQLERAGAPKLLIPLERLKQVRAEDRQKTTEEIAEEIASYQAQKAEFQARARVAFRPSLW